MTFVEADRAALSTSHRVSTRLEVLSEQVAIAELPVLGGTVTLDTTAAVRRRCRVDILGRPDLIPRDVAALLAPYGNEIKLYRGYPGRQWPLGVFRIEDTRVVDEGGRIIRLSGFDRSHQIALNRPRRRVVFRAGSPYTGVIAALADLFWPDIPVALSPSERKTAQTVIFEEATDIWRDAIRRMAAGIGQEVFLDGDGVLSSRRPPALRDANVVYDFTDRARSAMVGVEKIYSAEPGHNVFVVTGEAARNATPVRAVAEDLDPTSPTFVGGKYGRRARFYRSEFIHSTDQAQETADGLLSSALGGTEQLEVTHWPISYLEGSDVIHVGREAAGIDDLASIQTTSIDLAPDALATSTTRRRRSLAI